MARYCEGDVDAFHELYRIVAPRLFGYLVKMSRQRAVAADLLQHTFMKVHRARRAYIRGADPVPWMYAIAHRTFLDEMRRIRRDIVRLEDEHDLLELSADLRGESDERRDAHADPALVTAALAALLELPANQRQAVVLTKLEGKSIAEAAEIAGTTVGAMKVRAHRGYKELRRLLDRAERSHDRASVGGSR